MIKIANAYKVSISLVGRRSILDKASAYDTKGPRVKTQWRQQFINKSGNKTFDHRFGANLKINFLLNFAPNLLLFCVFQLFSIKKLKMKILTHVWGAQLKCWLKYSTKDSKGLINK